MFLAVPLLAAVIAQSGCDQVTPATPPPSASRGVAAIGAAPAKPPAPAFKPGMTVFDRDGVQIGSVQTMTETPGGLNVVVKVDGMMVGVPASTLTLDGSRVTSSQTLRQIMSSAGAPPR